MTLGIVAGAVPDALPLLVIFAFFAWALVLWGGSVDCPMLLWGEWLRPQPLSRGTGEGLG